MKRTNIYLDEDQDRTLRHLAVEEARSFTDIVREALNEYLTRRGLAAASSVTGPRRSIPERDWQFRFRSVLERMRTAAMTDEKSDDVEAEITAAWEEARSERLARQA